MPASLEAALDYLHAEISVIPIQTDGSKSPMLAWQPFQKHSPTEKQARAWFANPVGIGIVCGAVSGIETMDFDDVPAFEAWRKIIRDPVCVIATPKPGRHVVLHRVKPAHNQKLALTETGQVLVETRGEGGYILAPGSPGSCHPSGRTYEHLEGPTITQTRLAPPLSDFDYARYIAAARMLDRRPDKTKLPRAGDEFNRTASWEQILEPHGWTKLQEHETWTMWRRPGKDDGSGSATTGFCSNTSGELLRVFSTNAAPFEGEQAYSKFRAHALLNHDGDFKAAARALRGVSPESGSAPTTTTAQGNDVLIPGSHTLETGEYVEVTPARFARETIDKMPDMYLRAEIAGEIIEGKFRILTEHRARLVASDHCRFVKSAVSKGDDPQPVRTFVAATRDHGALVIGQAANHPNVRRLDNIVTYPVFDPEWKLCKPGYSGTTFYQEPKALRGLVPIRDPTRIRETLLDLIVDFPFKSESDRHSYIGLLLTPLIRPAINGNIPLHLISSPAERTGKTKLASEVFGGIYLGAPVPAMQFTGSADEQDKRILGLLLAGTRMIHFDNLPQEMLASASLASLLTAAIYSGRILGRSENVEVLNSLTIAATGNNIRVTSEIGKRTIPIELQSDLERPEARTDFIHKNIADYTLSKRRDVLGCLVGMALNWQQAGSPSGSVALGGFDRFAEVVGGVCAHAGFDQWGQGQVGWRESADEFTADLRILVTAWAGRPGLETAAQLLALAGELNVFEWCFKPPTDKGKQVMFGAAVLKRIVGRVIDERRIVSENRKNGRVYILTKVS